MWKKKVLMVDLVSHEQVLAPEHTGLVKEMMTLYMKGMVV